MSHPKPSADKYLIMDRVKNAKVTSLGMLPQKVPKRLDSMMGVDIPGCTTFVREFRGIFALAVVRVHHHIDRIRHVRVEIGGTMSSRFVTRSIRVVHFGTQVSGEVLIPLVSPQIETSKSTSVLLDR